MTVRAQSADLSLTKTVDDATPDVGDTIVFTVTLTNGGPDAATNVVVVDALPGEVTHVSDDGGGAYDPATGLWDVGSLPASSSATLTVTARVVGSGTITNTAQVADVDQGDPDSSPGNNVPTEDDQDEAVITVAPAADLTLTKTVDTPAPNVGDQVTFTVTLRNDGPDTATNVAVTDTLTAGLSEDAVVVSDGSYAAGVWSLASLAPSATATCCCCVPTSARCSPATTST